MKMVWRDSPRSKTSIFGFFYKNNKKMNSIELPGAQTKNVVNERTSGWFIRFDDMKWNTLENPWKRMTAIHSYVNLNDVTIWKTRETVIRIDARCIKAFLMSQSMKSHWNGAIANGKPTHVQSNGKKKLCVYKYLAARDVELHSTKWLTLYW